MSEITVTLSREVAAELGELAVARGRSRAELVRAAITRYLVEERLARGRAEDGFWPGRAGELASDEEVGRIFRDYVTGNL